MTYEQVRCDVPKEPAPRQEPQHPGWLHVWAEAHVSMDPEHPSGAQKDERPPPVETLAADISLVRSALPQLPHEGLSSFPS